MTKEVELAVIYLGEQPRATGFTRHLIAGEPMPPPAMLRIVKYDDHGFYLLYCSVEGAAYTDTWHETMEHAMDQAGAEFNVKPTEWTNTCR
ncbi:MAG: hypothetical protein KF754_09550 [Planctomycetes bacterium]|nr:hypothetical protein [Planctomycetota bacterium]